MASVVGGRKNAGYAAQAAATTKSVENKSTEVNNQAAKISALEEQNRKLTADLAERDKEITKLTEEVAKKVGVIREKSETIKNQAEFLEKQKALHEKKEKPSKACAIIEIDANREIDENVCKPTTNEMRNKLIELNPLSQESKGLIKSIDSLRSDLQRLCETKELSIQTLQFEIRNNAITFHNLAKQILELNPKLLKQEKELEEMITKATHNTIPTPALNALSAYNSLPLTKMQENEKIFNLELASVKERKGTFRSGIDHFSRRFGDIVSHLNDLNYALGSKTNTNGYLSLLPLVGGSSKFVSPESPSYTGKEGLEEIKKD